MILDFEKLEIMERTTMEMVVQAIKSYWDESVTIFREEKDHPGDIAEDVMREAMDAMGVSNLHERLYGKVDYKKSIYVFIPQAEPVALMLDAKAEKGNGSATIQMSQTSMRVMFNRQSGPVNEQGKLMKEITREDQNLKVVSIVVKYVYSEIPDGGYNLETVIVACIPNGILQDRYNPSPDNTIWRVGRNAPTLGEDFRVRLVFDKLKDKASWRVRYIEPQRNEKLSP